MTSLIVAGAGSIAVAVAVAWVTGNPNVGLVVLIAVYFVAALLIGQHDQP